MFQLHEYIYSSAACKGGTEWYLDVASFVLGVVVGVVLLGILGLFCYRRLKNKMSAKSLQESKAESRQKPEGNSVYEELNLNEISSGNDYYQSVQGNSDNNEVLCENGESTYTELNTIREEENKYESLK